MVDDNSFGSASGDGTTCLLTAIGPAAFDGLACDPQHTPLLAALLEELGCPSSPEDAGAWLLVAPIPADAPIAGMTGRLLAHPDEEVRLGALDLVGGLDPEEAPVEAVAALAVQAPRDLRAAAIRALGRLKARDMVPALVADWGEAVVDAARIEALVRMDGWSLAAPHLADAPGCEGTRLAMAILGAEQGEHEALADCLGDLDSELLRAAGSYLASRPEVAAHHVDAVLDLLAQEELLDTGWALARAAGRAGGPTATRCAAMLGDADWQRRRFAAMALAYVDEVAAAAGPLEAALDDEDDDVRREAVLACAVHGLGGPGVQGAVCRLLTETEGFVQRAAELADRTAALDAASMLLGASRPEPDLLPVLLSGSAGALVRSTAALLLATVEPQQMAPLLDHLARDGEGGLALEVRRAASAGLALCGRAPDVPQVVHRILLRGRGGAIDPDDAEIATMAADLAALALTDTAWEVRIDALRLLGRLGPAARPFSGTLAWIARNDDDPDCRAHARSLCDPVESPRSAATHLARAFAPGRGATFEERAMSLGVLRAEAPQLAELLEPEIEGLLQLAALADFEPELPPDVADEVARSFAAQLMAHQDEAE